MARVSYLVDSDILIDWLKGRGQAKTLIWNPNLQLYCSNVSRKELLSKRGLKDSVRQLRRQPMNCYETTKVIHCGWTTP